MRNEVKSFRLNSKIKNDIKGIIEKNPEKYESVSHFVRCSVIKLIKQERGY